MKLFTILYKNFKLLLRSKSSAFTVFIGPMIIIALILFTFSSSEEISFSVGVVDTSDLEGTADEFTESLVAEGYSLVDYTMIYDCIEDMKSSKVNLCLHFPGSADELELDDDLSDLVDVADDVGVEIVDDSGSDKKQVVFYVDQSRINIVESIMLSVGQKIEGKSEEMTEEKIKQIIEEIGLEIGSVQSIANTAGDFIDNTIDPSIDTIKSASSESVSAAGELGLDLTDAEFEMSVSEVNSDLVETDYEVLYDQLEDLMSEVDSYVVSETALETEYDAMEAIIDSDNITANIEVLQASLSSLNLKLNEAIASGDVLISNSDNIASSISDIESKIDEISAGLANIKTSANTISALAGQNVENEYEIQFNEIVSSSDKSLFMFPYYLMLLIVFVGMMLSSNLVNIEKQSLAFFRNNTSPTSNLMHLLARFGTNFSILFFQVAVVLVAAIFYLEIPVMNNYAVTFTILLLTITFFIFFGYLLGYIFKTQEGLTIGFISVGSISAFLSNLILPIETFSQSIRDLLMFNPYMLSSELLKKSLIFESGFVELGTDLWTLVAYVVIVILAVLIMQKVSLSMFSLNISTKNMLKRPHITRYNTFKLEDGTIIEDLDGLVSSLKNMSNEEFLLYGVGKDNEFSLWIKDAFKMKKAARKITKVHNRLDTIKVLNEYLKNTVKK